MLVVPCNVLARRLGARTRVRIQRSGQKARKEKGTPHLDDGCVSSVRVEGLDRVVALGVAVDVPVADGHVLGRTEDVARLDRVPAQSIARLGQNRSRTTSSQFQPRRKTVRVGEWRGKKATHPSLLCPVSRMSGLQVPPGLASLACFVRSNTYTSPLVVLVASRLGFWGMYRARLISPW